jgi:DNA-binding protein YbaB
LDEVKIMTGKGQGGFGFGLGKMKELTEAFKKLSKFKKEPKSYKKNWMNWKSQGEAGGGLVKVYLSGNQETRRVEISPDVLGEGAMSSLS